jgi:hypothetical protein
MFKVVYQKRGSDTRYIKPSGNQGSVYYEDEAYAQSVADTLENRSDVTSASVERAVGTDKTL